MKIKNFVEQWSGHGYEKGETHSFWLRLIQELFDISIPEKIISFEVPVPQGFITEGKAHHHLQFQRVQNLRYG